MKHMKPANRAFKQTESHPSSMNPGIKSNKNSYKTTPVHAEEMSGSKGAQLSEAASTMYSRAVKNGGGTDAGGGDQALRHR